MQSNVGKTYLSPKLIESCEWGINILFILYFLSISLPSPVSSLLNILSYPVVALLVLSQWKKIAYLISQDLALLILILIAVFSVTWSVAPGSTLPSARGLIRLSIYGVYLAARYSVKDQLNLIAIVCMLAGLLSVLIAVGTPQYGTEVLQSKTTVWNGIFPHKNFLSRVMTMSSVLFLNLLGNGGKLSQKMIAFFGVILSILLIILSQSKTALLALILICSLSTVHIISKQKFRIKTILFVTASLICFIMTLLVLGNIEYILVDLLGKNLEFNGRLPLWQLGLDKAFERPWLGYGYDAFWNSDESLYVINNSWGQSFADSDTTSNFNIHNGYLEVFISLGIFGISVFLFCFFRDLIKAFILVNVKKNNESFWFLQFLVFNLIFNMAVGSTILTASNVLWSIYVSTSFSITLNFKNLKKRSLTRITTEKYVPHS